MNNRLFALLTFFTLLAYFPLMAQTQSKFDAAWQKTDKFIKEGLPKSALEEVEKIYALAKTEDADAQLIKALVYKSRLVRQVEEDDWYKNVQSFEKEIDAATEPAKQVLHSIAADLYWSYFQNQRYRIYNRSNTVNFNNDDPETWSTEDFHQRIMMHYKASLQNAGLLQQTSLENYEPVIVDGNRRNLRPTLYDLLAHKALDYYKTTESDLVKPSYQFQLDGLASLAPANVFLKYDYESRDSSSQVLAAIKLYQDIISFHLDDKHKAALVDADIERIAFAYEHNTNAKKEALYSAALEEIYRGYNQLPEAMQAGYLLALWWRNKGDAYQPGSGTEEERTALGKAYRLAKEVAKKFPSSEGSIHAANLARELERPALRTTVEKVNVIGEPFRALVTFKNTNVIYLRVLRVTDAVERQLAANDYDQDSYWRKLMLLNAVRNWPQPLPVINDYREHNAEIKIDPLPNGKYILFVSKNNDFNTGDNAMAATAFYVSNISYVNNTGDVFFLGRQKGNPLNGANVQLWYSRYDYSSRKNLKTKGPLLKADKNGYLQLPKTDNGNYRGELGLEVTYEGDRLFLDDNINYNRFYNNDPGKKQTDWDVARYFIFTDRSIYRPGQTVYFKAIGIVPHAKDDFNEKGNSLFLPEKPVTIELLNANGEVADTMALTPNEYGSIHGSFKLPETGLTGSFQLHVKMPQYSAASFNVEAYKRPKFFVEIEKPTGTYRLGDTIQVTGQAKAYAGNNISGATVSYRVQRVTRFLYPWMFWRSGKMIWPPPGHGGSMEITHGETTTDANGNFTISFEAIPDLSVDTVFDPAFDYTIEADVIDINGETRSATNTISVGYKSLLINIARPGGEQQMVDSFKHVSVSTTNLGGEPVSSNVSLAIYRLKAPERMIRERYWETPDTTVLSYSEFVRYFPHDEYRNESKPRTWQKGKMVQQESIKTDSAVQVAVNGKSFGAGWYMIEASAKDKDGKMVKAVEFIALSDPDKNLPAAPSYHVTQTIDGLVQPGDKAKFMEGSSASDVFVVQQLSKADTKVASADMVSTFSFLSLNKELNIYQFPVTEADRGGYAITRFFVKDNRFYTANWMVEVPWTNKELKISFETFRDKLLPGQDEKWSVKISGYKGDAVAAEMLASMYDASLDQFMPHNWQPMNIWNRNNFYNRWNGAYNFTDVAGANQVWQPGKYLTIDKRYDRLMTVNQYSYDGFLQGAAPGVEVRGQMSMKMSAPSQMQDEASEAVLNEVVTVGYGRKNEEGADTVETPPPGNVPEGMQIRRNFNETAFFFPDLHTNKDGDIEFSFTMPEALTEWKLQTLAHTKDLRTGLATKSIVTQKELMVQPNAPRFFRQGDSLTLVTKVVNLSDKVQSGEVQLELMNASTMQPVNNLFGNTSTSKTFTIPAGQSVSVGFPISIPASYTDAVTYRIIAKAENISDGEEMALPVLSNRMLVTESFPLNMRNTNTKTFTWDKLLQSANSATLLNQSLTVEYTSNPVWYAVQALPYLMEYPYDCAEQTWNRFYANALASKIANSMPKIKAVFEQWKNTDTAALLSNLQKNEELKAVLLEETPWVLQAKNESEQKKNIALLFDMVRMSNEAEKAIYKLKDLQSSNGGFVWFKGGPDDRYMTQYIVTGMGHLRKLNAWPAAQTATLNEIVNLALPYLDARIKEEYNQLIKSKVNLDENHLSSTTAQYLYMRSFFEEKPIAETTQNAYAYWVSQAKQYWLKQNKYEQGMIALALHRMGESASANNIMRSLTENSITSEEFGMYWKEFNSGGYYWWQAPIESHALLTEAYSEIENNSSRINDLKTWLLKQKQTQNWRSTKATAEACYALLLQGDNWLNAEQTVTIQLGGYVVKTDKTEAGTGYFKQTIAGEKVSPQMGNITVSLKPSANQPVNQSTSWGAVYWQYFQDLDNITTAETPLSIQKQLFIQRNSDRGPVITPVSESEILTVGDRVKVRIEIRSDRNLEYVHLKDMRASCFEPVNVLSSYKYQDGLGYYESTLDASTNFFINYLSRGTYVFEYDLLVSHTGEFSNGISSIQCMYAPEFSAHSEGIRVMVK